MFTQLCPFNYARMYSMHQMCLAQDEGIPRKKEYERKERDQWTLRITRSKVDRLYGQ